MKVIKISLHVSILCAVLFFLISFIPIINLALTENKITKLPLTNYYFAKIETGEKDFDVFKEYMERNGWIITSDSGNTHIFEKDGDQIEIIQTQVKTLFIDGNINYHYLERRF
ncbi:hypothetical protein [Litchfieldia alkalitelluris]|uniref:hypothetical protein n=1 Tax=Litchfieldia alkalitelluris TaxID=304268 RepID=UPI00099644B4|nr:hypothetical protein [Litchfieldia alkalitelluris]